MKLNQRHNMNFSMNLTKAFVIFALIQFYIFFSDKLFFFHFFLVSLSLFVTVHLLSQISAQITYISAQICLSLSTSSGCVQSEASFSVSVQILAGRLMTASENCPCHWREQMFWQLAGDFPTSIQQDRDTFRCFRKNIEF